MKVHSITITSITAPNGQRKEMYIQHSDSCSLDDHISCLKKAIEQLEREKEESNTEVVK